MDPSLFVKIDMVSIAYTINYDLLIYVVLNIIRLFKSGDIWYYYHLINTAQVKAKRLPCYQTHLG